MERRSTPLAIALAFFLAFTAGLSAQSWGAPKVGDCSAHQPAGPPIARDAK